MEDKKDILTNLKIGHLLLSQFNQELRHMVVRSAMDAPGGGMVREIW